MTLTTQTYGICQFVFDCTSNLKGKHFGSQILKLVLVYLGLDTVSLLLLQG